MIWDHRYCRPDAATRIGELINEALKLAPEAGLILEIKIKPAKKSAPQREG